MLRFVQVTVDGRQSLAGKTLHSGGAQLCVLVVALTHTHAHTRCVWLLRVCFTVEYTVGVAPLVRTTNWFNCVRAALESRGRPRTENFLRTTHTQQKGRLQRDEDRMNGAK